MQEISGDTNFKLTDDNLAIPSVCLCDSISTLGTVKTPLHAWEATVITMAHKLYEKTIYTIHRKQVLKRNTLNFTMDDL